MCSHERVEISHDHIDLQRVYRPSWDPSVVLPWHVFVVFVMVLVVVVVRQIGTVSADAVLYHFANLPPPFRVVYVYLS